MMLRTITWSLTVSAHLCFAGLFGCFLAKSTLADEPPFTDAMVGWRQYEDPAIEAMEDEYVWPTEMQMPWLRSLRTEESDLRREVADTIVFAARLGMDPMDEYETELRQIALDSSELTATRLSATNALIACDFRESATALAGTLKECPLSMRLLIEKAFADWGYKPIREVWLARLQVQDVHAELFRIATESLGTVGELDAVVPLREVVESETQSVTRRLLAAAAWSQIAISADQPDPTRLEVSRKLVSREDSARSISKIIGLRLLAGHDSEEAKALLVFHADDPWNVVRGEALRHLLTIAPQKVVELAEGGVKDSDANVRGVTIAGLATDASERSVRLLAECLSDPVPENRRAARDHLIRFAKESSLREAVVGEISGVLGSDGWRELEQALLVLTEVRHREVKGRVFELLNHSRAEVFVTAAWSLKYLAEASWGSEVFAALERQLEKVKAGGSGEQQSYASAHLVEAMGMLGYRDALPLLGKMFPKGAPFHLRLRCGAVWAAGHLVDVEREPALVSQIENRFLDYSAFPPEDPEVRAMAAVALGQMKSEKSLVILRDRAEAESVHSTVGIRAFWAVSELTGEPMPERKPVSRTLGGWAVSAAADVQK